MNVLRKLWKSVRGTSAAPSRASAVPTQVLADPPGSGVGEDGLLETTAMKIISSRNPGANPALNPLHNNLINPTKRGAIDPTKSASNNPFKNAAINPQSSPALNPRR